jgi:regulatory protein
MQITALKAQVRDSQRVNVYVDGVYSFSLGLDDVLRLKIKNNQQVTEDNIASYKKISQNSKITAASLEWVLVRPRSVKELQDYLRRKKIDPDVALDISNQLQQKGYIDQQRYATWTTERLRRKAYSSRAISAALLKAGIAKDNAALTTPHTDTDALMTVLQKVASRPRYADPKKLTAYLLSKGFLYSDVRQALVSWQQRSDEPSD